MFNDLINFFKSFFDWSDFWESFFNLIKDALIAFVDLIIKGVASLIDFAISLLPSWAPLSPLAKPGEYTTFVLQCLNWIFPVSFAIQMFSAIVLSLGVYLTVGIALRWAKVTN